MLDTCDKNTDINWFVISLLYRIHENYNPDVHGLNNFNLFWFLRDAIYDFPFPINLLHYTNKSDTNVVLFKQDTSQS